MRSRKRKSREEFQAASVQVKDALGETLLAEDWEELGGVNSKNFFKLMRSRVADAQEAGFRSPDVMAMHLNDLRIKTWTGGRWNISLSELLLLFLGYKLSPKASRSNTTKPEVNPHKFVVRPDDDQHLQKDSGAVAAPNIQPILDRLPEMRMIQMVNLWRNALAALSDPKKERLHRDAKRVLEAVRHEWRVRELNPVSDENFQWPSTEANRGAGILWTEEWVKEGALKYVGYKVGAIDGETVGMRQRILDEIFDGPIPPVFARAYLAEWGSPGSSTRLRKMAETIASLARNAKRRRDMKMATAVEDWEQDLGYLYDEYYIGRFRFAWPHTKA